MAWLAKAHDPSITFGMLSDSGGARFIGLDSMLAAGLQSKIHSGELYLRLKKEMILAMNRKTLLKGRQVVHLICDDLRLNESMSMV